MVSISDSGYANLTIGKSYEYQSDPYDRQDLLARVIVLMQADRTEKLQKFVGGKAFIPSSASPHFFNTFAGLSNPATGENGAGQQEQKKEPTEHLLPFKPTSRCNGTINPYPSYEPPKTDAAPPKKDVHHELIFKPSGITGSYPIRSIIASNTPIAPPIWMQDSIKTSLIASRYE
jgi:hypothetical protein